MSQATLLLSALLASLPIAIGIVRSNRLLLFATVTTVFNHSFI